MQNKRTSGPCIGFDTYAGKRWIYPNNLEVRGYQKAAVEMALFNNAMIVLPTGFGKTFIAAVVMYNFYRWYPSGKIVFVAPTRPLVAQQIQECRKISGIPKVDCIELTGMINSDRRREFWDQKRVFFATPQVIENDLTNGLLPAQSIRCIVIDEAHKAQGNYAYVNIVKYLQENNKNGFRVLALSATPGSDIQKVQQVMLNLYINEVMFRSENSLDLMQYKNQKCSKAWLVEITGKHKAIVDKIIEITDSIYKELYRAGLTFNADSIDKVAGFLLLRALHNPTTPNGRVKYLCNVGISLCAKFELLTLYGLRCFYTAVTRTVSEPKNALKTMMTNPKFKVGLDGIMDNIRSMFGEDAEIADPNKKAKADLLQGHPKLFVVKDLLMKHFQENEGKSETRAIVFSKYRESVYDILQTLKAFEPVLKPAAFVGQGKASGTAAGMKQRDQIQLMSDFKAGKYNVLIATSVAEEGLDIGEVDLIINYDTSSSPISSTQRRGRTGRKRSGNVQSILTKGYEEKKLQKAGNARRSVEEQLYKKENYVAHKYRDAPKMVPDDIIPICFEHKVYNLDEDGDDEEPKNGTKNKRKRRSKTDANDNDLKEDNVKKQKASTPDLDLDFKSGEEFSNDCEIVDTVDSPMIRKPSRADESSPALSTILSANDLKNTDWDDWSDDDEDDRFISQALTKLQTSTQVSADNQEKLRD